jgi:hypothetical protein
MKKNTNKKNTNKKTTKIAKAKPNAYIFYEKKN